MVQAVQAGYAGATTDTGHKGSSGSFGMLQPGMPDVQLQTDFGWYACLRLPPSPCLTTPAAGYTGAPST